MEAREVELETICLPVLGTGGHGLNPEELVEPILQGALTAIRTVESLKRIFFVEIDEERAVRMSHAMDKVLGRVSVALARGELVDAIRSEAEMRLQQLEEIDRGPGAAETITSLRDALSTSAHSSELGIAARRLAEHVLAGMLSSNGGKRSLYEQIELVRQLPVAPWIVSYLTVLRIFGNEAAHHKSEKLYPSALSSDDLALCLFAIQRVLDFWIAWLRKYQYLTRPTTKPEILSGSS